MQNFVGHEDQSAEMTSLLSPKLSERESSVGGNTLRKKDSAVIPWAFLLSEARNARKRHRSGEARLSQSNFQNQFLSHFSEIDGQLTDYLHCVSKVTMDGSEQNNVPKDVIMRSRAALRFGLSCLAIGDPQHEGDKLRSSAQHQAVIVDELHLALGKVLSQAGTDIKCRILSAQLLSNVLTCNYETALVAAEDIQVSPSSDAVSSRIKVSISLTSKPTEGKINWVDMMLSSVREGNRDALEAIVAAIHNCLASLPLSLANPAERKTCALHFARRLASDKLLVNTFLRHVLSVDSIKRNIQGDNETEPRTESHGDATTEWIVLLVEKLCRFGLLSEMYDALVGESGRAPPSCDSFVAPEHAVLLHCVERVVDDAMHSSHGHPFGDEKTVVSTNVFLAMQASSIRNQLIRDAMEPGSPESEDAEFDFRRSVHVTILEILASSLGAEGQSGTTDSRIVLGHDVGTLQDVSRDLGKIVDELSVKNQNRKARELNMSDHEQRVITVLVRLVGNLCFQCRQNQDIMRSTRVPLNVGDTNGNSEPERTALHVLLSCTSFSYCCFTLREWAIVALRNVLDNNEENQKIVAELEVQEALSTPELQRMGLSVNLDRHGKMTVLPPEKN